MKINAKFWQWCLACIATLSSLHATAECTISGTYPSIANQTQFSSTSFSDSKTDWTSITTITPKTSTEWSYQSCGTTTTPAGYVNNVGAPAPIRDSDPSSKGPVYNITAIPGVAYSLSEGSLGKDPSNGQWSSKYYQQKGTVYAYDSGSFENNPDVRIEFWVTTERLIPGTYTLARGTQLGRVEFGSKTVWRIDLSVDVIFIVTPSCTISTTYISVPLGSQSKSQFINVNDASASVPFNIDLTGCAANKVNITINGTADPDYTNAITNGVLQLTQETGHATGVGIQLRRADHSVLPLNTLYNWKSTYTSGSFTLPLEARYIKNNAAVTAGKANSVANFVMSFD